MINLLDGSILPERVEDWVRIPHQPSFSAERISVLHAIGKQLLRSDDPGLVALGFWLREASQREQLPSPSLTTLPLGVVFHVAPSNVDLMAIYSWVCGFVSGNANIVRFPSTLTPRAMTAVGVIGEQLQASGFESENVFLQYPREATETTRAISLICDARMLWGGDATIAELRSFPTKSNCRDVGFGNRVSLAVLNAEHVLQLSEPDLHALMKKFLVDVWTFNQHACSSPRLICWIGSPATSSLARERFWNIYEEAFIMGAYGRSPKEFMDCLVEGFLAATRKAEFVDIRKGAVRVYLISPQSIDQESCDVGGGLFQEISFPTLESMGEGLQFKFQTMIHAGFALHEIVNAVLAHLHVDRIVPLGRSADFGYVWDGFDLRAELTRRVDHR